MNSQTNKETAKSRNSKKLQNCKSQKFVWMYERNERDMRDMNYGNMNYEDDHDTFKLINFWLTNGTR